MKRTPNRVGGENSCCCMRLSEEFLNKAARSWAKTELSRGDLGLSKPTNIPIFENFNKKKYLPNQSQKLNLVKLKNCQFQAFFSPTIYHKTFFLD